MFYREAGDFKTSYSNDSQTFPIKFDRYRYYFVLFVAFAILPFILTDYWAGRILGPFLVFSIAAIGLNILTGYCGQVSLGTGGFMAVGAYSCFKFMTGVDIWYPAVCEGSRILFFWCSGDATYEIWFQLPPLNILLSILMAGVITAAVGVFFGLPSLRIKGFYLAVATLAAQFFLIWLFNSASWFYNFSATGQITAPDTFVFGTQVTGAETKPWALYMICLVFAVGCAWIARNLTRGTVGRTWMAIRDMDIAAEIIGVNPLKAKLTAFAVSSFFIGIAGALLFSVVSGSAEAGDVFGIQTSFQVLFIIIIGGLGSIFGSFAGAAFIVLLPVALRVIGTDLLGWPSDLVEHFQFVIVGGLIIFFLIVEPHGLAQLWRLAKEKLRLWPFPY
ncbi:branched-chain amino acid ABC transporter permease [Parasulfitobacter algicola]|uniref:Branched-chain amino acid ABC transporter permease n=1 Tax=Parasulfitobacter algicola TaxID=2614809 RepID=A0ABX2IXC3_9RHOB|nr:branched-chain amino acid ABC transporter permease [Sulfitobacter algicola]NSX54973.1 branched-chain amino acid ABC transporter permease [Sulfitobacter algicola]